ncbi:MAG: hydroxymethylbilane synthase [Desulfurispora sp.]|uniref:hydroxymethylbilane synthase n=1 Tax=Desulfurispora sp. TaxID=3014275 RepID=UPI00404916F8
MTRTIRIGTRESALAVWQARWVQQRLAGCWPEYRFELVGMKTKGDKILDTALARIGDKGLFTKELEQAMLRGEIDLAVHSMKDLPTKLPAGLFVAAVCPREYPGDGLVSRRGLALQQLPPGARIGTSSLRRQAQLKHYRPDLQFITVRGNVQTRLRKLEELELDALVLACAGLVRLGLQEHITQRLPYDIVLPAVGQGSIGVEARQDDDFIINLLSPLDHPPSRAAITAERAFLQRLEGGCQVPIGALGLVDGEQLTLQGVVAALDGRELVRDSITGPAAAAAALGVQLAETLLVRGAARILQETRQEFESNG